MGEKGGGCRGWLKGKRETRVVGREEGKKLKGMVGGDGRCEARKT